MEENELKILDRKLPFSELQDRLNQLPEWTLDRSGHLVREFQFVDFARAMVFLNEAMNPIEEFEIYPRVTIVYNRVQMDLFQHNLGVVSHKTLLLAKALGRLVKK